MLTQMMTLIQIFYGDNGADYDADADVFTGNDADNGVDLDSYANNDADDDLDVDF